MTLPITNKLDPPWVNSGSDDWVHTNGFVSPKADRAGRQYIAALIDAVVLIQSTTVRVLHRRRVIGRRGVYVHPFNKQKELG